MIEARATVVRVEAGRAWVKVSDRQEGCGRCDEPGGCRSLRLAYSLRPPTDVFSLPDAVGLKPGDLVRIRMRDGAPLRGAMASYGLGAGLLLVGAATGHVVAAPGWHDGLALLGALCGLALAVGLNRLMYRSRRWRGALAMDMVPDGAGCALEDAPPA